ncbi:MAG: YfbM family protein [Polyangiales bacterium]
MSGNFRHVSARALQAMIRDPSLAMHFRSYDPSDSPIPAAFRAMVARMPAEHRESVLEGLKKSLQGGAGDYLAKMRAAANRAASAAGLGPEDFGDVLDIDKAWHGVHIVLAGTEWEPTASPGNVVLGGTAIGEDGGYGPVRYLTVEEVREAADHLAAITDDDFRARYDPKILRALGAYAMQPEVPEERDWLASAFGRVREYYVSARDLGRGMLLFVS